MAVVVGLVLGYPLSFGPACWISGPEHVIDGAFCTFYRPLLIALQHCPQPVRNGARWYFELWLPSGIEFIGEPKAAWFLDHKE